MKSTAKRVISIILTLTLFLFTVTVPQTVAYAASKTAPAKITGLKITTSNKYKVLKLTWDKQAKADGYQVYRSTTDKSGSYKKIATLNGAKKNSFVDKNLKNSKTYYYEVRAFKKTNGKTVYGKFAKTNLSTRLTKTFIKNKIVEANDFFVGWVQHGFAAYDHGDFKDTKPITNKKDEDYGYCKYFRIRSKKYKCVADLKKEGAKHFKKSVYEDMIDRAYADINGKLYMKSFDTGGDNEPEDVTFTLISLTDKKCKVRITVKTPTDWDESGHYTFDKRVKNYTMVYTNGKWVFTEEIANLVMYNEGNNYWNLKI